MTEVKIIHNIPSVSQIAPLPANRSHGILPVLSLEGRNTVEFISSDDETTDQPVG